MIGVQIFGIKNSHETRAAERFFKERNATIHFVDLKQKPMSAGEIKRFIERFALPALLDREGKSYIDAGSNYLKLSDSELLAKIARDPNLLRLPLVRSANRYPHPDRREPGGVRLDPRIPLKSASRMMEGDSDDQRLARNIIEVHGADAATIARGNARGAALAGQPIQAKSWIRVLGIIQRRQAAPNYREPDDGRPAD